MISTDFTAKWREILHHSFMSHAPHRDLAQGAGKFKSDAIYNGGPYFVSYAQFRGSRGR